MREFGIIGEHLSHTLSPRIYNTLFKKHDVNAIYKVFEIPHDSFDFLVKDIIRDLKGFNVTIPYKSKIMGYLNLSSSNAWKIGAVNVVNDKMEGFNTDWKGFKESLKNTRLRGKYALVIGAGGAARAVCFALKGMGLDVYVTNRTKKRAIELAEELDLSVGIPSLSKVAIVVNATPLGMYPNVQSTPDVDLSKFSSKCVVYDLVYNPHPTKFLVKAQELGIRTMGGLEMLIQQAISNLRIWSLDELADNLQKDHQWVYDL